MNKKQNLRFFLALGNTKMVLLKEEEKIQVYSKHIDTHKCTINEERVLDAASGR